MRLPALAGYFLRPELVESAYYLYRATKSHKFLAAGRRILNDLERFCWTPYGYASVFQATTLVRRLRLPFECANQPDSLLLLRLQVLEDSMPSYFLSETLPYLHLLFNPDSPFHSIDWMYTTEGHPLPLSSFAKTSTTCAREEDDDPPPPSQQPQNGTVLEAVVESDGKPEVQGASQRAAAVAPIEPPGTSTGR